MLKAETFTGEDGTFALKTENFTGSATLVAAAKGYFLKDSEVSDVIACIEAIRSGGIYLSPSLGRTKPTISVVHTGAAELLEGLTATELLVLARVALFETRSSDTTAH